MSTEVKVIVIGNGTENISDILREVADKMDLVVPKQEEPKEKENGVKFKLLRSKLLEFGRKLTEVITNDGFEELLTEYYQFLESNNSFIRSNDALMVFVNLNHLVVKKKFLELIMG